MFQEGYECVGPRSEPSWATCNPRAEGRASLLQRKQFSKVFPKRDVRVCKRRLRSCKPGLPGKASATTRGAQETGLRKRDPQRSRVPCTLVNGLHTHFQGILADQL